MADDHTRTTIRSSAPWEPVVGYSRAVRVGRFVAVSGSIQIIQEALEQAGDSLNDGARTRMCVTDIDKWGEISRAHQEAFGNVMPATSMVEVSRLIDSKMVVEIEADAIVGD
jgi:enamine deaminase RidA (YjgF/YER057c/UK114 family)